MRMTIVNPDRRRYLEATVRTLSYVKANVTKKSEPRMVVFEQEGEFFVSSRKKLVNFGDGYI